MAKILPMIDIIDGQRGKIDFLIKNIKGIKPIKEFK